MMTLMTTAILFAYGLLFGSFLNAWIWRIHTGRKISKGRSMCPHCKTTLKWYELIPVLSWIGLRGKCRTCRKPISIQYPLVELATGILWAGLYLFISPLSSLDWLELLAWLIVGTLMVAAFVYDAKWMLLPDHFTVPAIAASAVWVCIRWVVYGQGELVLQQVLAALIFAGIFYALWRLSGRSWLGDGDIRLALLMGLMLTPSQLIIAIFVSFNLGALVSLLLLATKRKTRRDPIAFGPFLIVGLLTGFFAADALISAYFRLLSI
jgi:prepilin signal peptidase PulO-like enzyme (type II secretory pathway)